MPYRKLKEKSKTSPHSYGPLTSLGKRHGLSIGHVTFQRLSIPWRVPFIFISTQVYPDQGNGNYHLNAVSIGTPNQKFFVVAGLWVELIFVMLLFNKVNIKPCIFFNTGISSPWWENSSNALWHGQISQLECPIEFWHKSTHTYPISKLNGLAVFDIF